jgi:hypothetical protein
MEKLPQKQNGLSRLIVGIKGYIFRLFGIEINKRVSPSRIEEERLMKDMHDQFIELKKKGLSIPIFTL